MKKIILTSVVFLGLQACTSVQVKPIAASDVNAINEICIALNPAVTIDDFVPVVEKRIKHHGVKTRVLSSDEARKCTHQLQYSARRSWDGVTYLSWAELKIYKNGQPIGDAEYKLKGKGGLSLMKWQSVETKMNPVVDELFAGKNVGVSSPLIAPHQEQILVPKKIESLN
ncbi:Sbal_3080 family lipoprotein [Acinetobacter sp. BWR-L5]|uniref:Sbal_3080 family lipoprotein n=1 Tax=Acinetobacter sp. BWR-L5 TaxID=2815725 RepID=UPI0031FEA7DB